MSSVDLQTSSSSSTSYSWRSSLSEEEGLVDAIDPEQLKEMREGAKKVTEYALIGCCGASAIAGAVTAGYLVQPQIAAAIVAGAPVAEAVAVKCAHKVIDDGHCDNNLVRSYNCKERTKKHCVIQ